MSLEKIIRAWKDEHFRNSLSDAERALLPEHPAGLIDLTAAELEQIMGGRPLAVDSRMKISNDYYLIVDVEATCSNDGAVPRHEMEIIEIGAVMQNSRTFEIGSDFQTFVRPVRNTRLTAFCTELTGITQREVE